MKGWGGLELLLMGQKINANVVVPELRNPEGLRAERDGRTA